jgi:sigma54-dependent transcription regulator
VSARHTPGPWVSIDDYEVSVDAESNIGNEIAAWWVVGNPDVGNGEVAAILHFYGSEEARADANARLIAAAPDLLAALKSLGRCVLDQVESDIGRECRSRDLPKEWHTAAAAIAKAEGAQ